MAQKEYYPVSYSDADSRVLFEDVYQNLARKPGEKFRRTFGELNSDVYRRLHAAGEWVLARLRKRLCDELGMGPECYESFLRGDADSYRKVQPLLLAFLKYPEEALSPLRRHEKPGKPMDKAARWLDKAAVGKLCSQGKISTSTWYRFQNGTTAPGDDTLRAFTSLLKLNEEEAAHLKRLVRKDDIDSLDRLRPEAQKQWRQWQQRMKEAFGENENWQSLTVFWDYTMVSPNAMKVLGCGGETAGDKSSQSTLLKLNIAFRHSPEEGTAFLGLGDSDYYTMRDMLFLTCLYLKVYDVEQVDEILEFYAANPEDPSRPRLENPYRSHAGV